MLTLGGCYHSITIDMVSHVKLLRHDYGHDFPEPATSRKVLSLQGLKTSKPSLKMHISGTKSLHESGVAVSL